MTGLLVACIKRKILRSC